MNFLKALLSIPRLFREELEFLNEDIPEELIQQIEESRKECIHVWKCVKCDSMTSDDIEELHGYLLQ